VAVFWASWYDKIIILKIPITNLSNFTSSLGIEYLGEKIDVKQFKKERHIKRWHKKDNSTKLSATYFIVLCGKTVSDVRIT